VDGNISCLVGALRTRKVYRRRILRSRVSRTASIQWTVRDVFADVGVR
jgi:hypothetical protein